MSAPVRRGHPRATNAGFTLMETLVMLMLVSLATTMMFQMLESYRLAEQRIAAMAGGLDRSTLFDAWLIDSVHGLLAVPDQPFTGSRLEFKGHTLNPLFGPPGAPALIHWQLRPGREGGEVSYSEDGLARWTMPVRELEGAHFVYFANDGGQNAQWPPAKGVQQNLPAAIALIRGVGKSQLVRLAAVRGPLVPRDVPFVLEQE